MTERDMLKEGSDYLFGGCDSYTVPRALSMNEFIASMNTVCRGGIVQTRPGSDSLYTLAGLNPQGFIVFTPSFGATHHMIAVDGYIYVSAAPFNSYRLLPNLRFNPNSRYVVFEECLQSTEYTSEGELVPLDRPRKIMMIQDGATRAGYWDGNTSRHLNPSPSAGEFTVEGYDETMIGLWMKWSNNRLWVSHNGKVMASDLGNPLKFKDAQILNEGRAFYIGDDCTGMTETADAKGLIVFTSIKGFLFQSHVQDRTIWLDMENFQSVIFPKVGCVAPRSIVVQYGLIWWFSSSGLISSDQAMQSNSTSRLDIQDNEMICSKGNVGPDLSMICSATFENYLLVSVPSGHVLNRHTWCLDQAVFEGPVNAWSSYWTGWNPVQWSHGSVDGEERIFFLSNDNGCIRVWEAFNPTRMDNGQPITCFAQLREHDFGDNKSLKKFHNAEFFCKEILGDVSWMAMAAATKGAFFRIGGGEIVATPGGVVHDTLYDFQTCMYGHRPQTRTLRTEADSDVGKCNEGGVESDFPNNLDRAFSLMLVWSGRLGFEGYRMYANVEEDSIDGECQLQEVGPKSLSEQGCSSENQFVNACPFQKFVSSRTATVPCDRAGHDIQSMADAESIISQADADRKATGAAVLKALTLCKCAPEIFWNTEQSFTAFCDATLYGKSVTKRVLSKTFYSYKSVYDANAAALASAQTMAESALICVPSIVVEFDSINIPDGGSVNYGSVAESVSKIVTIKNNTIHSVKVTAISIDESVFSISGAVIPSTLPANSEMQFTVSCSENMEAITHTPINIFSESGSGHFIVNLLSQRLPVSGFLTWWDINALTGYSDGEEITSIPNLAATPDRIGSGGSIIYKTNIQNGKPGLWLNSNAAIGDYKVLNEYVPNGVFGRHKHTFIVARSTSAVFTNIGGYKSGLYWISVNAGIKALKGAGAGALVDVSPAEIFNGTYFLNGNNEMAGASANMPNINIYEFQYPEGTSVSSGEAMHVGMGGGTIYQGQPMYFFEFISSTTILSAEDRNTVLEYLRLKWGTP